MKKRAKFLLIGIGLLLMSIIIVPNVYATAPDAYLVMANPSADMSMGITIGWHTKISGTYVEVTTEEDTSFQNPIRVSGECAPISHFDTSSNITYNESKCIARIDNLEQNTNYIYRAGSTNFSPVKRFKTAALDEPFSFVYFSDVHIHNPLPGRLNMAQNVLAAAHTVADNVAFSVFGGDMLAYGSAYGAWESLSNSTLATTMMAAHTPGNHDFYDSSAKSRGPGYFNDFLYNPDNGAEGVKNTSYYFRYNNTLFISISSEDSWSSATLLQNQKDWFREVVEKNPAQFIVVYTHRPFYNGSTGNAGHALTNRTNWSPIFDEYGVDLVLTGHDHVYVRTERTYDGGYTGDPKKGTVYIGSTAIGDRYNEANPSSPYTNLAKVIGGNISLGTVFTVSDTTLQIRAFNTSGEIVDQANIPAKRTVSAYTETDKQAFMDSLNIEPKENNLTTGELMYDSTLSNYIYRVELLDENQQSFGARRIPAYSEKVDFLGFNPNRFLTLTAKVEFYDGEIREREILLSTKQAYGWIGNLHVEKTDGYYFAKFEADLENDQIRKYDIYLDDVYVNTTRSVDEPVLFTTIQTNKVYEVKLVAIDRYNDVIYVEQIQYIDPILVEDIVVPDKIVLELGEEYALIVGVIPNNAYQPILIFQSTDESIVSIDQDGICTANAIGTTVISVQVEGTNIEKVIQIEVTPPYEPIEEVVVTIPAVLEIGQQGQIVIEILPQNATNQIVEYSSSDESIATIDAMGNIYAHKVGVVQITVQIEQEDWVQSYELEVYDSFVPITQVDVDCPLQLEIGEEATIKVDITPMDATYQSIEYSSSNQGVLTVDQEGKIQALSLGVATITAVFIGADYQTSWDVEVVPAYVLATSISIQGPSQLIVGVEQTIQVTIEPNDATNRTITYESLNTEIATITSDGVITGLQKGIVRIRVQVDSVEAEIEITILAPVTEKTTGCGARNATMVSFFLGIGWIFLRKRRMF